VAIVAARFGLWKQVDAAIRKGFTDTTQLEIVKGERALARGQIKEVLRCLKKASRRGRNCLPGFFRFRILAKAYEKQDVWMPRSTFCDAPRIQGPSILVSFGEGAILGAWWMRTEIQLAISIYGSHGS
jgi:hypothetical protein